MPHFAEDVVSSPVAGDVPHGKLDDQYRVREGVHHD
jgi:hypothetical protein